MKMNPSTPWSTIKLEAITFLQVAFFVSCLPVKNEDLRTYNPGSTPTVNGPQNPNDPNPVSDPRPLPSELDPEIDPDPEKTPEGDPEQNPEENPDTTDPETPNSMTETFTSKKSEKTAKTDILWVLDTSASMKNEIDHVNKNMRWLIEELDKHSDPKIAVMYENKSYFNIEVEFNPKGAQDDIDRTIKRYVHSKKALTEIEDFLDRKTFFRKDAKANIIIVTDDDDDMDNDDFLKEAYYTFDKSQLKVFAFAGRNNDCKIANKGREYEKVAKKTGGRVFDICDRDWKNHFEDLAAEILVSHSNEFNTKNQISKVVKVLINGNEISSDKYSTSGNRLKIENGVITEDNTEVTIEYFAASSP